MLPRNDRNSLNGVAQPGDIFSGNWNDTLTLALMISPAHENQTRGKQIMPASPFEIVDEAHDLFFGSVEDRLSEEQQIELDRRLESDADFQTEWDTLAMIHDELHG